MLKPKQDTHAVAEYQYSHGMGQPGLNQDAGSRTVPRERGRGMMIMRDVHSHGISRGMGSEAAEASTGPAACTALWVAKDVMGPV